MGRALPCQPCEAEALIMGGRADRLNPTPSFVVHHDGALRAVLRGGEDAVLMATAVRGDDRRDAVVADLEDVRAGLFAGAAPDTGVAVDRDVQRCNLRAWRAPGGRARDPAGPRRPARRPRQRMRAPPAAAPDGVRHAGTSCRAVSARESTRSGVPRLARRRRSGPDEDDLRRPAKRTASVLQDRPG